MIQRRTALLLLLLTGGCPEGDTSKGAGDAGASTAAAKVASALLEQAKGAVILERGGKKGPAQLGYLYVGDALETGPEADATVRFPGGRVVDLGPDGRFEIQQGEGGNLVLSVAQGLVLTRAAKGEPQKPLPGESLLLTILTPFGLTRLGTGAVDFEMTVGSGGASLDVKLGEVDLITKDGKSQKIGAGQSGKLGDAGGGDKVLELQPIQVTLSAAGGKAELKKKDETKWSVMGKKPVPLAEGDAFRVKDGRVVLQAPGGAGTLAFSRGAEVTMEKAAKGGDTEETGFDFKKGELEQRSNAKTRLNLSGGVTLESSGSQYTLRRTKDGYELESAAGDVKVERAGFEPTTVYGGRNATIPLKGAVKSQEVGREAVTLPSRSSLKLLHANVGRLAITWDGEADKAYRVEVANDPGYKQKAISGVVHQRYLNVPAPVRGSLYWRVFDAANKEVARGSASFAPEANTTDLARNRNEVQDGADQTTIYFQDKPPSVTFAWQPAAEAAKYKVQVYRKENLSAPVTEKVVTEDKMMLPEGALGEGAYMWSLKFLDAKGAEVGGSGKMNKLLITYDNAVPNLNVKVPKNGDPGGAKVRCQGIAPVGAKVSVNGKPVALDEKSRFDVEAAPMGGGLLVFRMVNGASEVYTVRRVRKGK